MNQPHQVNATHIYEHPAARATVMTRPGADVQTFHRGLPGYTPTALIELPTIAAELGVGRVFVKDESARLGLPAFKVLGASYAIARALSVRYGIDDRALPLDELRQHVGDDPALRLTAATDGNHGRAVAHMARLLGAPATIFFPSVLTQAAKDAIRSEGATVVELDQPYDDVVQAMIARGEVAGDVIIQDTAWDGYREVPQWIVDGYSTLLVELDEQLDDAGAGTADLLMAPAGVGSLAQAITVHARSTSASPSVAIVEPTAAPTIMRALRSGQPSPIDTDDTIMTGLNCGTPSPLAWPVLRDGADVAVLVTDAEARRGVQDLADLGVDAGPCGAATLAGARRVIGDTTAPLDENSVVILLNTESLAANPPRPQP